MSSTTDAEAARPADISIPPLEPESSQSNTNPSPSSLPSPSSSLLLSKIALERARQAEKRKLDEKIAPTFLSSSLFVSGFTSPIDEISARSLISQYGSITRIGINESTHRDFVVTFTNLDSAIQAAKSINQSESESGELITEFVREEEINSIIKGIFHLENSKYHNNNNDNNSLEPEKKKSRLVVIKKGEKENNSSSEQVNNQGNKLKHRQITGINRTSGNSTLKIPNNELMNQIKLDNSNNNSNQWEVYWCESSLADQEINERKNRNRRERIQSMTATADNEKQQIGGGHEENISN